MRVGLIAFTAAALVAALVSAAHTHSDALVGAPLTEQEAATVHGAECYRYLYAPITVCGWWHVTGGKGADSGDKTNELGGAFEFEEVSCTCEGYYLVLTGEDCVGS